MINKILIGLLLSILLLLAIFGSADLALAQTPGSEEEKVIIHYFWGDGCPVCAAQKPFLDELGNRYPEVEIRSYEVWFVDENRDLLFKMAQEAGFEPRAVPTTFIGSQYWVGFREEVKPEMEAAVISAIQRLAPEETGQGADEALLNLPLIGTINLNAHSLYFSTAIISFVDGFNPCSLWVLSILLALVIHTGSRRKTLFVGLTFLLVTAGVYGLFIVGLFKVFTVVSFMGWIQIAVAVLALGFALINIKDYFWYKQGLSFTISDKHKPKIYQDFRGLLNAEKSILALVGATVVMALGIALVELPCTAGFPVLWTKLVSAQQVSSLNFAILLGLYMMIYLLDELLIFVTAVVTLRASKMEEKHGRVLKLIGGVVMLALALVLLFDPSLMNDFTSSLTVFAAAFGFTLIILVLHRLVLPRFGINIGSQDAGSDKKKRKSRPAST
jgi:cytochrome c biogenesis protein CcdA/glutaredoxin